MSDKVQLIKEEIERLDEEYRTLRVKGTDLVVHVLLQISNFIDSLPEESGCEVNFTTKNEDLDYLVISLEETIGTSPHSREVIKEHLQKAAEWQKQQMKEALQTEYEKGRFDTMQYVLEKIEEFLYLQLNNGLIECGNIEKLIEQLKNYMQNESEN